MEKKYQMPSNYVNWEGVTKSGNTPSNLYLWYFKKCCLDKSLLLCITLSYFLKMPPWSAVILSMLWGACLSSSALCASTQHSSCHPVGASPAASSGVPLELTLARGNFEHELWHPGPLPFGYTEEWEILLKTVQTWVPSGTLGPFLQPLLRSMGSTVAAWGPHLAALNFWLPLALLGRLKNSSAGVPMEGSWLFFCWSAQPGQMSVAGFCPAGWVLGARAYPCPVCALSMSVGWMKN